MLSSRFSKIEKISADTLKKYLFKLTAKTEKIIALSLPDSFGIIIDGWTDGSTHYVAVFACFSVEDKPSYPLLAISPLFDETNMGAESHRAFIGDVLDLFGKSIDSLKFLVADNAPVNTRLADLLGVPFVGCASHRFNLAVKRYIEDNEQSISMINSLMLKLRNVKQAGKLRRSTTLEPVTRNATRWSSTYKMLKRFFEIQAFIDEDDVDLADFIPAAREIAKMRKVRLYIT